MAFGPAKVAIGLSDIDEHAAQLRAGIAIVNAAIEGKVELVGTPCERLRTQPHLLRQTGRDVRLHSRKRVRQIANRVHTFGFTNPVLIDSQNMILAGHGRVELQLFQRWRTYLACWPKP